MERFERERSTGGNNRVFFAEKDSHILRRVLSHTEYIWQHQQRSNMADDDFLLNTLSKRGRQDQTRVNFMDESLMSSGSLGGRDTARTSRLAHGTGGRSRTPGKPPRASVLDSSRR